MLRTQYKSYFININLSVVERGLSWKQDTHFIFVALKLFRNGRQETKSKRGCLHCFYLQNSKVLGSCKPGTVDTRMYTNHNIAGGHYGKESESGPWTTTSQELRPSKKAQKDYILQQLLQSWKQILNKNSERKYSLNEIIHYFSITFCFPFIIFSLNSFTPGQKFYYIIIQCLVTCQNDQLLQNHHFLHSVPDEIEKKSTMLLG